VKENLNYNNDVATKTESRDVHRSFVAK